MGAILAYSPPSHFDTTHFCVFTRIWMCLVYWKSCGIFVPATAAFNPSSIYFNCYLTDIRCSLMNPSKSKICMCMCAHEHTYAYLQWWDSRNITEKNCLTYNNTLYTFAYTMAQIRKKRFTYF